MITGYTFDGLHLPAAPFAKQVEESLNGNEGILDGIEITVGTNAITINEGRMLIKGRQFKVIGSETVNVESTASGSLYAVLIVEIDLSQECTANNFEQVSFKYLSSAIDYPSLTQQDINSEEITDLVYQCELARFRIGTNGITDYQDKRPFLDFTSIYQGVVNAVQNAINSIIDGSAFMASPVVLFEGSTSVRDSQIPLLDNVENYDEIEIFYRRDGEEDEGSPSKSLKISANQQYGQLDMIYPTGHPTIYMQFTSVIVKVQGNKITYKRGAMYGITNGGTIPQSGQEYSYIITKVVGYRYSAGI